MNIRNRIWGFFSKQVSKPEYKQLDVSTPGKAEIDTNSPTWIAIEQYVKERISKLRTNNDSLKLDELSTAALRGQIKELKALATLPDPKSWKTHNRPT